VHAHTFYEEESRRGAKVQPLDIETGGELSYDNFVHVEVVDTGIGISQENVEKLFQQSTQIDAHRDQGGGGSGFGLLIAKKIVEMHGGKIGVRFHGMNQGSCFYFDIPLLKISREGFISSGVNSDESTAIASNRQSLNMNSKIGN